GSTYQPSPQSIPLYQKMFALYKSAAGTPLAVLGCPFNSNGSAATGNPPNGDGCANRRSVSQSSSDSEQVQTGRVDYNLDENNTAWVRLQHDGGLQAAYTDPINPPFTTIGGLNDTWVQGRRATRFFINDNLAWSTGAHELRFGINTRIFRLNDYNFGQGAVPVVNYTTLPQFIYGVASTATKTFPLANSQPYNFLNLDIYAQDSWKAARTLTWTFGVRATHNGNPVNPHNAL